MPIHIVEKEYEIIDLSGKKLINNQSIIISNNLNSSHDSIKNESFSLNFT